MTEDQLHTAAALWLIHHLKVNTCFTTSMNAGKRGWRTQAMMKRHSVRAGWPDIEIMYGGRAYFIELKSAKGRLSDNQKICHADLELAGCPVIVARSMETVELFCDKWGLVK